MDQLRVFQLFLLSEMRAKGLVNKALISLGASQSDLVAARAEIAQLLIEPTSPPSIEWYVHNLGEPYPIKRELLDEGDEASVPLGFRLPLWPDFYYLVKNYPDKSKAYMAGFIRTETSIIPKAQSVGDLRGWSVVEADVTKMFKNLRVLDEWFPMKDVGYEADSLRSDHPASFYILRFDHNLLQLVEPCAPPLRKEGFGKVG